MFKIGNIVFVKPEQDTGKVIEVREVINGMKFDTGLHCMVDDKVNIFVVRMDRDNEEFEFGEEQLDLVSCGK